MADNFHLKFAARGSINTLFIHHDLNQVGVSSWTFFMCGYWLDTESRCYQFCICIFPF